LEIIKIIAIKTQLTQKVVDIGPKHRQILHIDIFFEITMLIVDGHFIASLDR